jgi:hypothetical protein
MNNGRYELLMPLVLELLAGFLVQISYCQR